MSVADGGRDEERAEPNREDGLPLGVRPEGIPPSMRGCDRWVCWRVECRSCYTHYDYGVETCPDCDEDTSKVPVNTHTGRYASSTDPETWASFKTALAYHERDDTDTEGVGFVFTEDGPFVGIDIGDAVDAEGHVKP